MHIKFMDLITEEYIGKCEGVNIYKDPPSIKRMGEDIRGIINKKGNLFVEEAGYQTHTELFYYLSDKGLIPPPIRDWSFEKIPQKVLAIQRWEKTSIFYIGESYYAILPWMEEMMKIAQKNNPQYKFISKRMERGRNVWKN